MKNACWSGRSKSTRQAGGRWDVSGSSRVHPGREGGGALCGKVSRAAGRETIKRVVSVRQGHQNVAKVESRGMSAEAAGRRERQQAGGKGGAGDWTGSARKQNARKPGMCEAVFRRTSPRKKAAACKARQRAVSTIHDACHATAGRRGCWQPGLGWQLALVPTAVAASLASAGRFSCRPAC